MKALTAVTAKGVPIAIPNVWWKISPQNSVLRKLFWKTSLENWIRSVASGAPASRCSRSRAINAFFEKVRFLLGGGGGVRGPGLRTRGSLVNFLHIGEGQSCFILNRGRVTVCFARTKLLHVACILYIQAKLPVKINLNYLQVSNIRKLSSPN